MYNLTTTYNSQQRHRLQTCAGGVVLTPMTCANVGAYCIRPYCIRPLAAFNKGCSIFNTGVCNTPLHRHMIHVIGNNHNEMNLLTTNHLTTNNLTTNN